MVARCIRQFFVVVGVFFLQSKTFSECEGNEIRRLANFFFVGDDVDLVHFKAFVQLCPNVLL